MIRKVLFAGAAVSLALTPLATLSAHGSIKRDSAPTAAKSNLGGSNLFFIFGIAAVVAGIVFLSQNNDPVSA